jgi:hypothetical protein
MKSKISFLFVTSLAALLLASCGNTPESSLSSSADSTSSTSSAYSSSTPVSSTPTSALRKKETTLYVDTNTGTETEAVNVYFLDSIGDIPFLSMDEVAAVLQRSSSDILVKKDGLIVTVYRSENSATVTLNFGTKTITYDNLDLFAAPHNKASVLNMITDFGTTESGASKYMQSLSAKGLDVNRTGKAVTVSLSQYNIPSYVENGICYLPAATISDLLLSEKNVYLRWNGVALFMSGSSTFASDMTKAFFSAPSGIRSAEMARFNRNELVMALDFQYGLKKEHNITDFDSFFKECGVDNEILSTDPIVSSRGVARLIYSYLSDYHSGFDSPSAYSGSASINAIKYGDTSIYGPTYQEYQLIRSAWTAGRKAACQKAYSKDTLDTYQVEGDTAYVTFDGFTNPSQDYYTTPATASASDTFGILQYAHAQISAAGDSIKNVVLDLSCNPGGAINAGMYTVGWFLPYAILSDTNALSGAEGSFTYQSDLDLDGKYTTADRLSGKRLYCLVSPASFSCSNFVSSLLKISDQVRFIGRATRGGACIVQNISLADGSFIQTSGNRKLCQVQNGAYNSLEQGVSVDYSIDKYDDLYDRSKLTAIIDALS